MFKYELYANAGQVPYGQWAADGVKGLILDKDGTVTEVNRVRPVDEIIRAMYRHDVGNLFKFLALVSNNDSHEDVVRAASIMEAELGIGVLAISKTAKLTEDMSFRPKPHISMGLAAVKQMGLQPHEVGVIGDRRITDVEFGRRLGAAKVALCERLGDEDAPFVPVLRQLEKIWVANDRRRGIAIAA